MIDYMKASFYNHFMKCKLFFAGIFLGCVIPAIPQENTYVQPTISGTYSLSSGYCFIAFDDNNFTLTSPFFDTIRGTYSVSCNSIVFSQSLFGSNTWIIVDKKLLRDLNDDLWRKHNKLYTFILKKSIEFKLSFNFIR